MWSAKKEPKTFWLIGKRYSKSNQKLGREEFIIELSTCRFEAFSNDILIFKMVWFERTERNNLMNKLILETILSSSSSSCEGYRVITVKMNNPKEINCNEKRAVSRSLSSERPWMGKRWGIWTNNPANWYTCVGHLFGHVVPEKVGMLTHMAWNLG